MVSTVRDRVATLCKESCSTASNAVLIISNVGGAPKPTRSYWSPGSLEYSCCYYLLLACFGQSLRLLFFRAKSVKYRWIPSSNQALSYSSSMFDVSSIQAGLETDGLPETLKVLEGTVMYLTYCTRLACHADGRCLVLNVGKVKY